MNRDQLLAMIKQKQSAETASYTKTIKPVAGQRNRYRLLPSYDAANPMKAFQSFGQHYIKGADKKVKAVINCTEHAMGTPCSVCDSIDRAIGMTHDDLTLKMLQDAKASKRILLNVLCPDSDKPEEVQILEVPVSVVEGKSAGRGQPKVGGIFALLEDWDLFDLTEGTDIIISKSGEGLMTSYGVTPAGKSKPVNPAVLEKLHNLEEIATAIAEDKVRLAITSVNATVGLLPAPGASSAGIAGGVPASAEAPAWVDVSEPATPAATAAKAAAPKVVDVTDVEDLSAAIGDLDKSEAKVATPAPAAKPAASDQDLQSLLDSL